MALMSKVDFDDEPEDHLTDIAHKTTLTLDVQIQDHASKDAAFKESEDYKVWNNLKAKNSEMKWA